MKQTAYTLPEIADWDGKVSLPTVQRGFVWKPYQIENLWDSLMRGYPVGAFVLSPAEKNTFHILDGQQRATAICLGFGKETFRDSQDYYKVFIDLELPKADDSRKFIFRVITRSHPWGYRKQENNKTLTADNIRKAMDLYDVNDPLNTPLDKFFPYDAGLPVPFYLFIESAFGKKDKSGIYNRIKAEYAHWGKVKDKWQERNKGNLQSKSPIEIDQLIFEKIEVIYSKTIEMLDEMHGQRIPALYMNLDKILKDDKPDVYDAADEVENLFVRLNSGGTPLSGEELNYSILKAHLSNDVQEKIENACKQLFKPARFITIAYRLFQQESKEQQTEALTMRIKPKQFQRMVSTKLNDFETFVRDIINDHKYEGKTLMEYTQHVLAYDKKEQPYALPFLVYSKIADTAPELMFLLLYRIKIKGDRFASDNKVAENGHRSMLGILTLLMWFGKGENLKDHSKLLTNIWDVASKLDKEQFWSSATVTSAKQNNIVLPIPCFIGNDTEQGLDRIFKYELSKDIEILNQFKNETRKDFHLFLRKVIHTKDILLFAQRHFIESYFEQFRYKLEDTSIPFDWDHISPNNLVKNKTNIPRLTKDWYQTNGNFRAWPYALNRMDSDNSPAHKLDPLKEMMEDNVIKLEKWQNFIDNNKHLIEYKEQISDRLLEWSFCNKNWKECNVVNIKTDWKAVTKLIIDRNLYIIQEWYQELNIETLRKDTISRMEDNSDV